MALFELHQGAQGPFFFVASLQQLRNTTDGISPPPAKRAWDSERMETVQKKLVASTLIAGVLAAASVVPAQANGGFSATGPRGNTVSGSHWGSGPGGYYHGGYYHGGPCCGGAVAAGAVAGLAVGTVVGAAASRPAYVVPPPVFVAPPAAYYGPPPVYYAPPPVYRAY